MASKGRDLQPFLNYKFMHISSQDFYDVKVYYVEFLIRRIFHLIFYGNEISSKAWENGYSRPNYASPYLIPKSEPSRDAKKFGCRRVALQQLLTYHGSTKCFSPRKNADLSMQLSTDFLLIFLFIFIGKIRRRK